MRKLGGMHAVIGGRKGTARLSHLQTYSPNSSLCVPALTNMTVAPFPAPSSSR